MSSASIQGIRHPLGISVIVLCCFATLFLVYWKASTPSLSGKTKLPAPAPAPKVKISSAKIEPKRPKQTVILIWMWPFGQPYELGSCSSLFNISGCYLTADKNFYNKSDGVIIHHRDIHSDLSNIPKLHRPPFQKWLWLNSESPTNSEKITALRDLFNLTINYRQDADIDYRYGRIVLDERDGDFVPPSKSKLVCWIVSNWNPSYRRVAYYNELRKHVEIHTYGAAFGRRIGEEFFPIITSCKFYLSFENSIHKDYITEKLYNPLSVGTVPIVLGPSRQNYENFVPGDAFIHVDDYSSPKELADHILLLDKNEDMYRQYFKWRRHFKAEGSTSRLENTCRACNYIRTHRDYKVINNLDTWFWGN